MTHKLSHTEIYALHYTAVALRPDWHHNRPGSTWQNTLAQDGTPMELPHAENFWHAIQALHHYATMTTTDGTPVKRTPKFFTGHGDWWDQTRPETAAAKQPACEQHPEYGTTTSCRACKSEIAAGERPPEFLGKPYTPDTP